MSTVLPPLLQLFNICSEAERRVWPPHGTNLQLRNQAPAPFLKRSRGLAGGNPKASLTTQDNASKSSHQLPNRDLKSSLLGLHRCTDMQQALDSLQEASGGPVEAGRGVVTSAGGRQVKKALRNFADAHQGSS